MRKPLIILIAVAVFSVAALVVGAAPDEKPIPLTTSPKLPPTPTVMPDNGVVVNASNARIIRTPFLRRDDASAVEGTAILLPEATGGKGRGLADFTIDVPKKGTYYAWVRARWRNSCGNSLELMVDGTSQSLLGEDHVYGAWHWVRAGGPRPETFALTAGEHSVNIIEREDGIAFDQILFTTDSEYTPYAPFGVNSITPPIRLFADDFSRSPGHGMEAWELSDENWNIAFSFDPNRIPNQYGLVGKAANGETQALVKGGPWEACELRFAFCPSEPGICGAVLDAGNKKAKPLYIGIETSKQSATLHISGAGLEKSVPLENRVQINQWHGIVVERWAWILRVFIDHQLVFESKEAVPGLGLPGFYVRSGSAVFDDMTLQNIAFLADDGDAFIAPWTVNKNAKWLRPTADDAREALIGKQGTITLDGIGLPIAEVVLQESPGSEGKCLASAKEFSESVSFQVNNGPAHVRRLAVRYAQHVPDSYSIAPYRFDKMMIEDPSDYVDFTPEEYKKIQSGPNSNVTRRKMHYLTLISDYPSGLCPWLILQNNWDLRNGVLVGSGRNALLRYAQRFNALLDVNLRIHLPSADSQAEITLYAQPDRGLRTVIGGQNPVRQGEANILYLPVAPDGKWHDIRISVRDGYAEAQADSEKPVRCPFTRGDGGETLFKVLSGSVELDDIEFVVPERYEHGRLYAFDRREPDWWREGGEWLDHAGMACTTASSWIGLVAPKDSGMLWNKFATGPDALLGFTVSENTEWFGWHKGGDMTHRHYPFDNIVAVLGSEMDVDNGYRLEVNSRNRTTTALYRNGKEVASRNQRRGFPLSYIGGTHIPYFPRRCRVMLVKRGNVVRGLVNDVEVIRYEDPEPLDVTTVGVGGYKTRINFTMIDVRNLSSESQSEDR